MEFEKLETLRQNESALRLLRADSMPLIASFLYAAFLAPNRRSIPQPELESFLEEKLLALRRLYEDETLFPRTAKGYLEDWAHSSSGFLRKYYVALSDDAHFDLSPGAERAVEWLRSSLEERSFVGTESRMLTLFQLLRDFIRLTERDPEARLRELEANRAAIENEIEKVRAGDFSPLSATQAKERFYQIEETGRRLLGDFRQVEENFRELDSQTRERIAASDQAKGLVLDQVFGNQDAIRDSEQGKSFRAFWEFLLSARRQSELDSLLERTYHREEVAQLEPDPFLRNIRFYLLEAADKVYRTNSRLVEQLRKFLDDRAQLENRRLTEVIRAIEKSALELKGQISARAEIMQLQEMRPAFDLVMSRGLFVPPSSPVIAQENLREGKNQGIVNQLFQQLFIDERELAQNIRTALAEQRQISLKDLLTRFPLKKGLAELVGYLKLAGSDPKCVIDENVTDEIVITQKEKKKHVRTPRIIFTR